jgi:hypothetical protein
MLRKGRALLTFALDAIARLLHAFGCDLQRYYSSRPVPAGETKRM